MGGNNQASHPSGQGKANMETGANLGCAICHKGVVVEAQLRRVDSTETDVPRRCLIPAGIC